MVTALSAPFSPRDQRHEDALSALAEAVPALVFVTDADGWVVQANRRFHRYAGPDGDDAAGGPWLSFVHAHDRLRALAAWHAARDARHTFELQVRLVQACGRCGAFDCRAVPVYLDGDVDRWTFAAVASQGEPAAPAPEQPDAWFRHAFEHSAMGLARIAPGGHFVAVNEQLCRMLGYGRAQLLGSSIQHLALEPDVAADGRGAATLPPDACHQHRVEQCWRRADGSAICVALQCDRVPAEDGTGEHFVCVVEDGSEAQAVVAELAEREAMLERFVQSVPAALALFDGDMRYLAHSGCYPAEIGMPAGEWRAAGLAQHPAASALQRGPRHRAVGRRARHHCRVPGTARRVLQQPGQQGRAAGGDDGKQGLGQGRHTRFTEQRCNGAAFTARAN